LTIAPKSNFIPSLHPLNIATEKHMKLRVLLSLLFVMAVAGCKAPQKPAITDDTIVTSQVNGITLTHRHAVTPPAEFTQVNEPYRAMYPASLMSRPDYGGKVIRTLE